MAVKFNPQDSYYFFKLEPFLVKTSEGLCSAIRDGNYQDALELILTMNKDVVGEPDIHGQTALHWAALRGDSEELCRALLGKMDESAILSTTKENSQTALHFAARQGNIRFIELLTDDQLGQLANMEDRNGKTPLYYAVSRGDIGMCQLLYENMKPEKITLSAKNEDERTVLHCAVIAKKQDLVKALISNEDIGKELIKKVDKYGQTALHLAAGLGEPDICTALYPLAKVAGVLSCQTNGSKYTALHLAVHAKREAIVSLLTRDFDKGDRGSLVGMVDQYGQTALHWAAGRDCINICKTLYSKMTSEEVWIAMDPDGRKQTALHFAVQGKSTEIVKLLLEDDGSVAKDGVGLQDIYGQTALHFAASDGFIEGCRLLYEKMTPEQICAKTNTGCTALHFAVFANHVEVVKLLVDQNNDREKLKIVGVPDNQGRTALDWAENKRFSEIANILQSYTL